MLSPRATIYDRLRSASHSNQAQLERTLTPAIGSPEIRPVIAETQYAVITVQCPCGDATTVTLTGYDEAEAFCPCGRTWQVQISVEQVTDDRAGE